MPPTWRPPGGGGAGFEGGGGRGRVVVYVGEGGGGAGVLERFGQKQLSVIIRRRTAETAAAAGARFPLRQSPSLSQSVSSLWRGRRRGKRTARASRGTGPEVGELSYRLGARHFGVGVGQFPETRNCKLLFWPGQESIH